MRNRKPPDEKTPQANPSQSGQGGGDEPKYVTEEQLNRAISARLGDFGKKFEKSIETAIGGFAAKLDETLRSLQPPSGGGESKDGGKPSDIENHPLVKGLQKQIAEQKAMTESLKAAADADKAKARDAVLRGKLSEGLTSGGIDPQRVRQAVGILVDVEKRVRFADDDSDDLVFKDSSGDVDLSTGLRGWLKSEDAKIFMPPRGTQGSGDLGKGKGQAAGGKQAPSVGGTLLSMISGLPTSSE